MTTYCALTVRKLKPGSYDEWRKAWWPDDSTEEMPEGAQVFIVRNTKDPDEVIAFGLFEGDLEEMRKTMDPETEKKRQRSDGATCRVCRRRRDVRGRRARHGGLDRESRRSGAGLGEQCEQALRVQRGASARPRA